MSASLIFKAGALALACASTASASYVIKDDFSGSTFFDNFYFNDTIDPTHGFVEYISAGDSRFSSLAYYDPSTDTSIMRVDYTETYTPGVDLGRPSIRAQTNNHYQYGLFILDLAHMPGGACGSWPAFWTTSNDHWPEQGEIDIIENINFATYSEETLHAGPVFPGDVCEVVGNVNTLPNGQQTGIQTTYNCMWNATTSDYGSKTQYSGQGCSANNNNPNSFGTDFNLVGGGVYAMEWSDEIIQIWSWQNGLAPDDIANGTPDPTTWGNPIFTTWGGNCDIARHFIDHIVIFDTTFCGDWGNAVWESTTCYDSVKYPTCADYVGANPTDYAETYWEVRSLKIYEFQNPVVSSTSTTSASTTSTTSTSSAAAATTASSTTTSAAATSSLGPEPTFGDWVEIGCYTEATNSRALTLGTKVNYSTMELGICADYCLALNALYFGVEYGGECYCGDVLEAGSVPSPDGGCVMPCGGNPEEICGGSDSLNVYKYSPAGASSTSSSTTSSSTSSAAPTTFTTSSSSSSSAAASSTSSSSSAAATSSSAASSTSSASSSDPTAAASSSTSPLSSLATSSPVHVETVGSCQRLGCYTEGYNIRALTPYVSTDYAYMSPEVCQSLCPEYLYFGVEFSGECYCGNSINNGSTIVPDTECFMPCGGFPDEYCGAGDRLDLYYCGSGSSSSSSSSSSASPSTSSSLPAAQSSTSSYTASPSSSTSSDPAAASSTTSSDPTAASSTTSSDPAAASSTTSSYPSSPSSSTSSYLASPSTSASSDPASPAGAATSDPASPSSSTIGYPASPASSTSSSSCSSSHTESSSPSSSIGSVYSYASPSTTPGYSTSESSPSYSQSYTTETITTTSVRTISSCAPTVTNCPYGKIVTDTIAITTTYCPGNPTIAPTPTPYSQKAVEAYTTVVVTSYVDYCPGNGQLTTIVYSQTQVLSASPTYEAAIPVYTTTKTWTSAGETVCATLTIPYGAPVPTPETPATQVAYPTPTITTSLPVVKMVTETVKPVAYTPSSNYTVAASGSAAPLSYSASPYAASPYSASQYSASPYPTTSPVAYKGLASGVQAGSGLALAMVLAAAALFL